MPEMQRGSRSRTGRFLVGLGLVLVGACGSEADPPAAPRRPALAAELRPVASALDRGELAQARALAEAYLAAHPGDAQASFLIGLSFALADNHGAARPFLEAALEAAPDFDLAWEPLARTRFLLGDLAGAEAAYTEVARRVPGDPKGPHGLGLVALERGELPAATAHFRAALAAFDALEQTDPRQAAARAGERSESHARLGDAHFQAGDMPAARAEFERALALSSGNVSALYTLALVHRRLGEEALARETEARHARAVEAARSAPR